MSQTWHVSDEQRSNTRSRKDHKPRGNRHLRWELWMLGTLVVLSLLLVAWFWTLMLRPQPVEGSFYNTPKVYSCSF